MRAMRGADKRVENSMLMVLLLYGLIRDH